MRTCIGGLDSLARSIREEIIESDFYIEDPPRFDNNSSSTSAYGGIDAQTTGTNRFANRKSGKCRYQCGIFS